MGGLACPYPPREGGEPMSVYEAIALMLAFGSLLLLLLTYIKK